MAQNVLDAEQLVGQNRNQVHGQGLSGLIPQRVYNLAPHRAGGYAPYGRRVRLQDDSNTDITLPNVLRIVGYDQTGVSSFASAIGSPGTLSLFRDTTLYEQAAPAYSSPADSVHIANAGAYISRDAFLVLDRERDQIEPLSVDVQAVAVAGVPAETTEVSGYGAMVDVQYGDGFFIAVTTDGYILRSSDNGSSWSVVGDYSSGFNGSTWTLFRTVDYGSGVWIVADELYTVLRSTDNGDTWSEVEVFPGYDRNFYEVTATYTRMYSATHNGVDTWHIAARGGGSGAGGPAGILRSTDGGQTWASIENLGESGIGFSDTYTGYRVVVGGGATSIACITLEGRPYLDLEIDDTWGILSRGDSSAIEFDGWVWLEAAGDRYVAVNSQTGQIGMSPSWESDPLAVRGSWSIGATLDGWPEKARWHDPSGLLTIVGGDGPTYQSDVRIWQGPTVGGLTRATGLETSWTEAGGGAIQSVAYADDGTAVYVGGSSTSISDSIVMSSQATPGLASGTYNLFYVAYVNTEAGRLVFDLEREPLSFTSDGGSIAIQAQPRDAIIAGNGWLSSLPTAEAEAIVDRLRLDVYIQYAATSADVDEEDLSFTAATAENTIRYAFTVPFPDSPDEPGGPYGTVGRTLGQLPIGRQLVAYGAPTTAIFEKSRTEDIFEPIRSFTAIHNGRVWGLARQDEVAWEAQDDGISLEIANQFNRFVLTYTEVGWANLISDQSFIPIQPTQSQHFTGLLGTPSGLMVMFDNEIFLVTGDAAFGNLAVDLYLDMVGCDLYSTPAMIGGLVFVVWEGKIWALQAGQASEISQGQWRPDDPFTRIAAEPQTRSLLALTESGKVLRYLVDDQFWLTDPVSTDTLGAFVILPNAIDPDASDDQKGRARIVDVGGNVWVTYSDGTPDTPHLVYRDVDFALPERRTALYLAKLTLEGPLAATEYNRAAGGYDATTVPALFYASANSNNGDTHESVDPQAGGLQPYARSPGARRVNTLSFRLPPGRTKGYSMDLRFELRGMGYTDVVKLPIRFFYTAGGTTR